jgi:hypothetical protein
MSEKNAKNKTSRRTLNKAADFSFNIIVIVMLMGMLVMCSMKQSEKRTYAELTSGEPINPPPAHVELSDRQKNFVRAISDELIRANNKFNKINQMPDSGVGEKEKKKRATNSLYEERHAFWAAATNPTKFDSFYGVITRLADSKAFGGPNSGKRFLDVEVRLYGGKIEIHDRIMIEERESEWIQRNIKTDWVDLKENMIVKFDGEFIRYSHDTQWAHCCVAGADWPQFAFDLTQIEPLM